MSLGHNLLTKSITISLFKCKCSSIVPYYLNFLINLSVTYPNYFSKGLCDSTRQFRTTYFA